MCLIDKLSGDRIVSGQTSQLRQELVAIHVIIPGRSHRSLKCLGIFLVITAGGDSFNSAKFSESIDTMGLQRFDKLLDRGLLCSALAANIQEQS